jgi:hypothetical protein
MSAAAGHLPIAHSSGLMLAYLKVAHAHSDIACHFPRIDNVVRVRTFFVEPDDWHDVMLKQHTAALNFVTPCLKDFVP